MSVYVDDAVTLWRGQRWAHLMADTLDELHAMAARLARLGAHRGGAGRGCGAGRGPPGQADPSTGGGSWSAFTAGRLQHHALQVHLQELFPFYQSNDFR